MKAIYRFPAEISILCQEWMPTTYVEPFHWHAALEIGYCVCGNGWFYFGDKTFPVAAGDVFVVNNVERHIAQSDSKCPCNFIFVYFDASLIEAVDSELLAPFAYFPAAFQNRIPAESVVAQQVGQLVTQIRDELAFRRAAYRPLAQSMLVQICALLIRNYQSDIPFDEVNRSRLLYSRIQPAVDFIKNHFHEALSLADVAEHISLSASRTRHLFAEALGESFKEFLLQLRINAAKKLLIRTNHTIMEVCLESGFQSVASFYRAFGDMVGMTPQAYRDQMFSFTVYDEAFDGRGGD